MVNLPKQLFLSIVLIVIISLFPQSVFAAAKGSITIEPATVDVTLAEASSEARLLFTLTNNSEKPISLELFSIDFKQQDEFGRIALLGKDASGSYSYSLSSFLSLETNFIELSPGEKQTFTALASNRPDLSPGGHYAAIVARLSQKGKETTVAPAVSSMIFLRKTGGERFNLYLKDVQWPQSSIVLFYERYIRLLFQNEGNIHLVPYGRVEVKDIFGRLLYKGIINSPSAKVFPESRRYIPVELKKVETSLPVSFNTFSVRGNDSLKETTFLYETSFLYINPLLLLLLILVPVFILVVRRKRRKRQ